jgi:homoserine kinase type II
MSATFEPVPPSVLTRYGRVVSGLRWIALGSGGGFSGARIWRGDDTSGTPVLALKAWPLATSAEQLGRVHGWMGRAAHLPFVPAVLRTSEGNTFVSETGRVWDVCRWMSGVPCADPPPTPDRVANACAAVAALHLAWPPHLTPAPCPGILNRLRVLAEFRTTLDATDHTRAENDPVLGPVVVRAGELVRREAPRAAGVLRPWANAPGPIRPCVRDLRADHVLFTGDDLSGIVDYGAMTEDHPAVDLARLLGELCGEDDSLVTVGVDAYRSSGGSPDVSFELVRVLDRTGVLCSIIGWLRRVLNHEQLGVDPISMAHRITKLISRLEISSRA